MVPKSSSIPASLLIELHATVLRSWHSSDSYGNLEADYWTMELRVQSWSSKSNALMARFRCNDALDPNALYLIKGRMYVSPGEKWPETYVRIDSAKKFHGPGTIRSDVRPTFEVVAEIRTIHSTYMTLDWFTWDGYLNTGYEQRARATLTRRIPRSHTFINLLARIQGVMNGPDPSKHWQCTYIEPEVENQTQPTQFLDAINHSVS
jgi:hypothetical protein